MILFSIAVHEQPKVILNQVQNFKFFNPDCKIVLHLSASMPASEVDETKQLLANVEGVYLNNRRLWSGYGDGTQMKMHVVNHQFAQQNQIPFQYFCLHASNDMFIRPGLNSFIQMYDAGFHVPDVNNNIRWVHLERAHHDFLLKRMIRRYDLSEIVGAQVEGSFYKKAVIDVVMQRILQNAYDEIPKLYAHGNSRRMSAILNNKYLRALMRRVAKGLFYAKEEIYFPTLSQDLIQQKAPFNYCYINWQNNLNITQSDIEYILNRQYQALSFYAPFDVAKYDMEFFAVKRVDRNVNDPIRQFINTLQR